MNESEVDAYFSQVKRAKFNDNTVTDEGELRLELQKAKECGYAFDLGEEIAGIKCISAPIFDRNGLPVAAIWITGPDSRLPEEKLKEKGEVVKKYAAVISERLGYNIFI